MLSPPSLGFWLLALWVVGLSNLYNFLDGVDGIGGLQAVVPGSAWCLLGVLVSAPFVASVGAITAAAALGFPSVNWPPAKIFMGDAGSTVLGYVFAVMPLLLASESRVRVNFGRWLVAAGLLVWPFLADGIFTILRRVRKKENILTAHCSHFYQRLVITGASHQSVTCIYGVLAILDACLAWWVVTERSYAILLCGSVLSSASLGLWVLYRETQLQIRAVGGWKGAATVPCPPGS